MKKCSRKDCESGGKKLPYSEFYKKFDTPDGYSRWCRKCLLNTSRNNAKKRTDAYFGFFNMVIGDNLK
jgi:hypothetical protein